MSLDSELLIAAKIEDAEKVKELLKKGANPNARTEGCWTPLHWAALNGHLDVVKLLLEKGADLDAKSEGDWTPLHFAAASGKLDVVKFLLEKGADPNARNKDGKRPVDVAREKGHGDVVKFFESWVALKPVVGDVSIVDVGASGLKVGEWGVVQVVLDGRGGAKLSVEGDVDYMCDDSFNVDGKTMVEVYVKPKVSGRVPVKIVVESPSGRVSKLVELDVGKAFSTCSVCGAPVEPGAKYCWKCGAKLDTS